MSDLELEAMEPQWRAPAFDLQALMRGAGPASNSSGARSTAAPKTVAKSALKRASESCFHALNKYLYYNIYLT